MKCFYWLFIPLILAYAGALAQPAINFERAIIPPGTEVLNNHRVAKMAKDPLGFIWIATDQNLFRYDGIQLRAVQSGEFDDIDVDTVNKQLVLLSRNRLYLYSYLSNDWSSLSWEEITGAAHVMLNAVLESDSTLWVAHSRGVSRVTHGQHVDIFPIFNRDSSLGGIRDLVFDPIDPEIIWLAGRGGLFAFDQETGKTEYFRFAHDVAIREERLNLYSCLYLHENGLLFGGTWGAGINVFDIGTRRPRYEIMRQINTQFPTDRTVEMIILNILRDPADGVLWFNSINGSVKYSVTAQTARRVPEPSWNRGNITIENGPKFIDEMGRYWLGHSNGLRMLDPTKWQFDILDCPVMTEPRHYIPRKAIQESSGSLVVCVDFSNGLYKYDVGQRTWQVFAPPAFSESSFRSWDMMTEGDTTWVLAHDAVYTHLDGQDGLEPFPFKYENEPYLFRSFCRDDQGRFWIGGGEGLYLANPADSSLVSVRDIASMELPGEIPFVRRVCKDKSGHIWLIGPGPQMVVYHMANGVLTDVSPEFTRLKSFFSVLDTHQDDTWTWFGTNAGVFRARWQDHELIVQLASNRFTFRLTTDHRGQLWSSVGRNIYQLDADDEVVVRYGPEDGLPDPGVYGFEDLTTLPDGRILVSARKQFAFVDPGTARVHPEIPAPYLAQIEVNGVAMHPDTNPVHKQPVQLGPQQNTITFHFSAQAYSTPESVRFQYRLNGVDREWVQTSRKYNSPTYAHLAPGTYQFEVQAVGHNGIWSEPIGLQLTIATPFTQQWWFRLSVLIILTGLLAVIVRMQTLRARHRQRVQQQISDLERQALQAQMNPHFVFNALNSIQHLIAHGEQRKSMIYLNKFSKLLRSVLDSAGVADVVLSKEIENIEHYLVLESLRFEGEFAYDIRVDPELLEDHVRIPGFVLQPIIENAIHHGLLHKAGKGDLLVHIRDCGDYLECIIEDNGIGRVAAGRLVRQHASQRISHGLEITRKRLALIHKHRLDDVMIVDDLYDASGTATGTRVTIKLPVLNETN
ncbi:MAG: histidine kinase [Saprospiraceae bacterium]|nr:histidine kinase [Saprospiraceae bacterium]